MGDGDSLLLQRRRLRAALRRLRIDKGLTQDQVAREMDWSLSKVIRIEGARNSASSTISTNDIKALLSLYDITDDSQIAEYVDLARAARVRPWWSAYRGMAPDSLLELIEYESAASVIRQYETLIIPGILQTEDYARAVLEDYYSDHPPVVQKQRPYSIADLTELRTKRQELLEREKPPTTIFRLDEAAIRRIAGSVPVMRAQLKSLVDAAKRPNITIEIIPFSAGLHSGLKGPFEVIEFAIRESAEDVVFLESSRGDSVSEDATVAAEYREAFDRLGKISLDPQESADFIEKVIDQLT